MIATGYTGYGLQMCCTWCNSSWCVTSDICCMKKLNKKHHNYGYTTKRGWGWIWCAQPMTMHVVLFCAIKIDKKLKQWNIECYNDIIVLCFLVLVFLPCDWAKAGVARVCNHAATTRKWINLSDSLRRISPGIIPLLASSNYYSRSWFYVAAGLSSAASSIFELYQ